MNAVEGSAAGAPAQIAAPRARRLGHSLVARFGVLAAFVVTCVVFGVLEPSTFVTSANLTAILTQAAPLAVVAFGLTVVLAMGDFDLSVAAMANLAGAVAVILMAEQGVAWPLAVLVALAVAVAVGIVNGLFTAYAGASSFIITLAAGTILTGAEYTFTDEKTLYENVPNGFVEIGQGSVGGVSYLIIIGFCVFVLAYVLLEWTELGRRMRAVGGNPEAAHLAGINIRGLRLAGFVIVAVCAAVAGVMLTAQAGSSSPNQGTALLLPAFAAAFLGSTSFQPGEFNAQGTLLGVLFLAVIQDGLTVLSASPSVINLVQGAVLILAVLLTRLGSRRA
ncbi:MAG: transporter permease [Solirubrobacterales bacterium]|nr:transporter permease [Solirubrobacterales bacterium]